MGGTYLPGRFAVSVRAAVINFRKPPYSALPAMDRRDKNRGEQNCTKTWRRGGDSNPCIKVLQTSPLATWVPRRWELRQPGSCQRKRRVITQPVYAVKKLVFPPVSGEQGWKSRETPAGKVLQESLKHRTRCACGRRSAKRRPSKSPGHRSPATRQELARAGPPTGLLTPRPAVRKAS